MRANYFLLLIWALFFQACSSHFFYPDQRTYRTPAYYDLKYKEIEFLSKDKTALHAWHIYPQEASKGLVFVAHGNGQNLSAHFISWVWLVKQGYEVFIFDYREYGKSQGESSIGGSAEDTIAALDYLESSYKKRYVAAGQSLGGTMLLNALKDRDNSQIKAVVIDSTFVGFSDIASEKMSDIWLTWPFQWIPELSLSNDFNAKDRVSDVNKPLLFIHGSLDKTISANHSWQLFELSKVPKELWIVKNAEHIQGLDNKNVQEEFLEFIDKDREFYNKKYSRMKIYE